MKHILAVLLISLVWITALLCGTYIITTTEHWVVGLIVMFMGLLPSVKVGGGDDDDSGG